MKESNDLASYYFHQGTNFRAYEYLGCIPKNTDKGFKYVFRVWAPNAVSVGLVSDFTGWDEPYYMNRITDGGVYECELYTSHSLEGCAYKFKIITEKGALLKGDPYARFSRGGDD
jgi:1,4-alpha-glucan branching enzyme